MMLLMLLLQAAQPSQPGPAAAAAAPDIQLDISGTARRVVVDSRGRTSLVVRTAVNGREGDSNVVQVEAPTLPRGQRELRDVNVRVHAEARVADPQSQSRAQEPQQRR